MTQDLPPDTARLLEEAREALRSRDDFLNAAAHELKTPMTTIMGLAQLARRRLASGRPLTPEETVRYLTRIASQTARLSRIVEQLLEGAQLQTGSLRIYPRPTNLGDLVAESIDLLMVDPAEHPIEPHLPKTPLVAEVDPQLLRHVVLTLLDNAVRAHRSLPGAPPIPVKITLKRRSGFPAGFELSVRDHGVPLPPAPEEQDGITADRSTLQLNGDSLGLAVSRHVLRQHGGTLTITHPSPTGTLATITLPGSGAKAGSPSAPRRKSRATPS